MVTSGANNKQVDCQDATLVSGNEFPIWNESTLPQVVAAGRLYILNGKGEYEQVYYAQYWRDGNVMSVSTDGFEYDEQGETTRVFQEKPGATD